jgi:hypothetical protein
MDETLCHLVSRCSRIYCQMFQILKIYVVVLGYYIIKNFAVYTYRSQSVVTVVKSCRLRWVPRQVRFGKTGTWKTRIWKDNIEMDFRKISCKDVYLFTIV